MKKKNYAPLTFLLAAFTTLAATRAVNAEEHSGRDKAAVGATMASFHGALAHGDADAAMQLLAPDAIILEGGNLQTRAEYQADHLAEDIAFAQKIHQVRSDVRVHIEGSAAWLTAQSKVQGEFEGRAINSKGVELVVLTKSSGRWLIRAIHWSSERAAP